MKTKLIAAVVIALVGTVQASTARQEGFFVPKAEPENPIARQTTCTLAIVWEPTNPRAVALYYVNHRIGGPVSECGATEDQAVAAALQAVQGRDP